MTRDGWKWLLIFHARGNFIARHDSPIAKAARREGFEASKFRTLDGASAMLWMLRLKPQPQTRSVR